ncbi:hypothetical protein OUZ56_023908 [Daphnia magna]|uniref:Uncharacterized protein n=1 Tax=Daphnia magna TaxID=35525 RepID=A0ABR0AZS2_9CRUS|nr:hypothetical protein OUZ56_023908 [Daphnia magna]
MEKQFQVRSKGSVPETSLERAVSIKSNGRDASPKTCRVVIAAKASTLHPDTDHPVSGAVNYATRRSDRQSRTKREQDTRTRRAEEKEQCREKRQSQAISEKHTECKKFEVLKEGVKRRHGKSDVGGFSSAIQRTRDPKHERRRSGA